MELDEELQRYIIELSQNKNEAYKRYYTYIENEFLSIFINSNFIEYDVFIRIIYDIRNNNILFKSNLFDLINYNEEDEYYNEKIKIINEIVDKIKAIHSDDNIPKQVIQKILSHFSKLLREMNDINISFRSPTIKKSPKKSFKTSDSNFIIDESFLKKIYVYSTISPKTHKLYKYYDIQDHGQFKKVYITINEYEGDNYLNMICEFTEGTMRNPECIISTNINDIEIKKKIFIKITKTLLVKFTKEKVNMHYLNIFLKKFGAHSDIKLSISDMNELIKIARTK